MEEIQTHNDIRSASVLFKRAASENEKYWGHRHIKPGQLGAAHYKPDRIYGFCCESFPADLSTCEVEVWDKRRLFQEAQRWPRPPTYKRSIPRNDCVLLKKREEKRWRVTQLARDPDGTKEYSDFVLGELDGVACFCDSNDCWCQWFDSYGSPEAWVREGEIAEECARREREAFESLLDGAVERFSRKFRRRLEEDGWSYVDQSSPRAQGLDLEWEAANDGWETLSLPD